ncbi:transglycosylase domain-containing protein [Actinoplanes sp. G11-F43]|uniref:transglycosylase domain-containing protein n=1 Tax=Actinoplanes sp. G11-F43 TaxID=3424130 RepID=UPI003D325454
MTITEQAAPARRGRRIVLGVAAVVILGAGAAIAATTYYDSVALVESTVSHPAVVVADLPRPVSDAFVAAVDPDFYESNDSLLTRRYVAIEADTGEQSGPRIWVMARKAESTYAKTEILDRYLNRADFGGAIGLATAAQARFQKPAAQLTVAEAAVLAALLHPDAPSPRAGWEQILDTMADKGWLTVTDRNALTYPG